jgi:alpha-tubulin suppressor-like RCC1 family protein
VRVVGFRPGPTAALALLLFPWASAVVPGHAASSSASTSAAVATAASLPSFADVDGGQGQTCAVSVGGAAMCWGSGEAGKLGNGTTKNSTVPLPASGLSSGVTMVSAGSGHSCAVTSAGAAKCWGRNTQGALGNHTDGPFSPIPIDVSGLSSGVVDIAAGNGFTCAVQAGAAKCWGWNYYGTLGNGTKNDSEVPVTVAGLSSGVVAITAGGEHACAVTATGAARCWGANFLGSLGDGTQTESTVPVAVSGLSSGVVAISAGAVHTCAVTSTGAAKCWGANFHGQLGNGTTADSSVPVGVGGLSSGVVEIGTGDLHTCARTSGGAVKCWGWNHYGEVGNGTTQESTVPVIVNRLGSGIAAISVGAVHSCAITNGGVGKCWGDNGVGSLGNGTGGAAKSSSVPVNWTDKPALHLALSSSAFSSLLLAGTIFTVTATVSDDLGNAMSYNGPASWSDLSGTLSPATPSAFVNGVSKTQGATIPDAYSGDRVTISGGGLTAQSNSFDVIRISRLEVRVTAPAFSGHQFTVTVTARDSAGNKLKAYNGAGRWSDLSGQLSPATPADFVSGVSTSKATIPMPLKSDTITVTSGGVNGTSGAFAVIGPLAAIKTTVTKPVTAGSPFTVRAQAVDSVGNIVRNYNATATWSDLSGQLSPATPANFLNGVSKTSATVSAPYANDKITVVSGGKSGTSAPFTVS